MWFFIFALIVISVVIEYPALLWLAGVGIFFGLLRAMGSHEGFAFNVFFARIHPFAPAPCKRITNEIERRENELQRILDTVAQTVKESHPYAYQNLYRYAKNLLQRPENEKTNDSHPDRPHRAKALAYLRNLPTVDTYQRWMIDKKEQLMTEFKPPDKKNELNIGVSKSQRITNLEYDYYADRVIPTVSSSAKQVVIPKKLRTEHMYMIGKTGAGKTNTFTHLILQDIRSGQGCGVIAPMGSLFEEDILPRIPKNRLHDVVYLNLEDTVRPITINPLALQPGEEIRARADSVKEILLSAIGEVSGSVMSTILDRGLAALIERPGSTLMDLERLCDIEDSSLRDEIIATTKNERTYKFWSDRFYRIPSVMTSTEFLTIRFEMFAEPPISTFLCSPKSSVNLKDLMDNQKIVLINLDPGGRSYGKGTVRAIGQILSAQFEQAIVSRTRLKKKDRTPFYLYIDEFDVYAAHSGTAICEMMARARQLGLGLILAHQNTNQISGFLPQIVGNAETFAAFRVGANDVNFVMQELINLDHLADYKKLDMLNRSDYADKIRTQIRAQGDGLGFVRIGSKSHLVQVPLVTDPQDFKWAKTVKSFSARNYGLSPQHAGKQPRPLAHGEPVAEDIPSHIPQESSLAEQKFKKQTKPKKKLSKADDFFG